MILRIQGGGHRRALGSGLAVGDYFELTDSSRVRIPDGKHFCLYALSAILPLLPAKQRLFAENDWLERDTLVAAPTPKSG
jgi:uncharacterized repeat protein (TIGR04076 family)